MSTRAETQPPSSPVARVDPTANLTAGTGAVRPHQPNPAEARQSRRTRIARTILPITPDTIDTIAIPSRGHRRISSQARPSGPSSPSSPARSTIHGVWAVLLTQCPNRSCSRSRSRHPSQLRTATFDPADSAAGSLVAGRATVSMCHLFQLPPTLWCDHSWDQQWPCPSRSLCPHNHLCNPRRRGDISPLPGPHLHRQSSRRTPLCACPHPGHLPPHSKDRP